MNKLVVSLAALVLWPPAAGAADLAKIERSIRKEPAYRGKPNYCLLVFGPEAKTRVWIVLDAEALYMDRNGNGDLTEAGERIAAKGPKFKIGRVTEVFKIGRITEADGKTSHELTVEVAKGAGGGWEIVSVSATSAVPFIGSQRTEGRFLLAEHARDAPIVHFDGSFTLTLRKDRSVVRRPGGTWVGRDQASAQFHVLLGTPVLGKDCDSFVRSWLKYPGPQGRPVAEITFPAKAAGRKPLSSRVVLVYR
jgi:hypothetical protein